MPSILKAHPTLGVAAAQLRAAPSNACAQCAAGNGDPCSCCPLSTSFYTLHWPRQPDENITKLKHNAWAAGYWGSLLSLLPTELLLTTSGKNILRVTEKISPKDVWEQSWGNRLLELWTIHVILDRFAKIWPKCAILGNFEPLWVGRPDFCVSHQLFWDNLYSSTEDLKFFLPQPLFIALMICEKRRKAMNAAISC